MRIYILQLPPTVQTHGYDPVFSLLRDKVYSITYYSKTLYTSSLLKGFHYTKIIIRYPYKNEDMQ